ncbi:MAG: hypothetical protein SFV24_16895 [Gemmatimonadales bacterium]|nr:hypothetical protein [Gemmatimonadales bacterium]
MIDTSAALARFESLLTEHGFDRARPEPRLAWEAFKAFAKVPVACSHDALLFQTGVYSLSGPESFQLDFTRQFELPEDGQYSGMEQLHCTFHFPPSAAARALATNLWSMNAPSLDAFFGQVEATPQFRAALEMGRPVRVELYQESV